MVLVIIGIKIIPLLKELMDPDSICTQLYFAGGESLVIDEHYELLEECIRRGHAKNIELRYNPKCCRMAMIYLILAGIPNVRLFH